MKLLTRIFGEAEIDENKIITFPKGIIGFPDLTRFALMYDTDKDTHAIEWLQSIEEPAFAMPVMDPLHVREDYNPQIEDDVLEDVKPLTPDNMLVLTTVTVPHELKNMTVNLKGPFIINADTRKGCQVILEDDSYAVKFPIYDILQKQKEEMQKQQ